MKSENTLWNKQFSHIYIEDEVRDHPMTQKICAFFPNAGKIIVHNYKEIFNRPKQNYSAQIQSRSLILARKQDKCIYEGSVMCHDFDEEWFYYCANVLNCLYDCEYCWLKGMYHTGNIVIFVNTEDYFKETEKLLKKHPVYLCLSYENDLVAMENMTGILSEWVRFSESHPDLLLEIRTKCADTEIWQTLGNHPNIIPAFTISPDEIIRRMEHGTPSLKERIKAVQSAVSAGFQPRLCFDPVFAIRNYREIYAGMIHQVMEAIDPEKIRDISIGTFRLSKDYMKIMRRDFPNSVCVRYPYVLENGYYGYDRTHRKEISSFMEKELSRYVNRDKLYFLEEFTDE